MKKTSLFLVFVHFISLCFAQPETYSFIWNGYLKEARNIERISKKQIVYVAKTEYSYDLPDKSSAYSDNDFYKKVKKQDFVYANMPQYEPVDFLPNSTAIIKDTLSDNELVITHSSFGLKNVHQPSQSVYSVWKQNKWLPQTKHEFQIDTAANSKTDTEYKWNAENSVWEAKRRKISSYPASKDTAQSVANFKYNGNAFVLQSVEELTYENGHKKEKKRISYNADLSIKNQFKTVYFYDDPSGYLASQRYKLNVETNEWETQGERRIHQSKRAKERERLANERQQMVDNWFESSGYELETDSRALTRVPAAGNTKVLREEMRFDPKTNKWIRMRIVTDR